MKFTCQNNRKTDISMKKTEKVSEYGLNQINKRVLLFVPKLITIGEGIPTPNDIIPMMSSVGEVLKIIS